MIESRYNASYDNNVRGSAGDSLILGSDNTGGISLEEQEGFGAGIDVSFDLGQIRAAVATSGRDQVYIT